MLCTNKDTQLTVAVPWITLTHPAAWILCSEWRHQDEQQKKAQPKQAGNINLTAVLSLSTVHHASAHARDVEGSGSETHFVQFWVSNLSSSLSTQAALEPELHSSRSECSKHTDMNQSLSNPHRSNSFPVWSSSSMNMWLISWLEYFPCCACNDIYSKEPFVFWKGVSILSQSWCLSDRSTSLRTQHHCAVGPFSWPSTGIFLGLEQFGWLKEIPTSKEIFWSLNCGIPVWESPNSPLLYQETWVLTLWKGSCCRGPLWSDQLQVTMYSLF